MPREPGPATTRVSPEETFVRTVERFSMIRGGDRVLAAVSGGGDSVLLLHLLVRHRARCPFTLHVGHLNHALRGAESDADEALVREMAARHALPFVAGRAELSRKAGESSSLEERARVARHGFLREAARDAGCNRIALGHTLDDQAETILMWLLRGTGRGGLSGMEPVTGDGIVRPLIGLRRSEVREHLRALGVPYRDDATNEDISRLRSRIRRLLVPVIDAGFEGAIERIAGAAMVLAAEESFLDASARARLGTPELTLEAAALAAAPIALQRRAIRLSAEAAGLPARALSREHVDRIAGLLRDGKPGQGLDLPSGFRAEKRGEMVVFVRVPEHDEEGPR
jgi:tRNA(Ile)-lysidine synthase